MNKEEQMNLEAQAMLNSMATQRNQALDAIVQKDAQITVLLTKLKAYEDAEQAKKSVEVVE